MAPNSIKRASLSFALVAILASGTCSGQTVAERIDQLAWMSGCWSQQGPTSSIEEHWTVPAGGTLLGVSRTVRGGRTVAHEFLQIREVAADTIGYIAMPSGQSMAVFRLTSVTDSQVSFENPEHDFPQRITYRQPSPDSLLAQVEAESEGAMRGFQIRFARLDCRNGF